MKRGQRPRCRFCRAPVKLWPVAGRWRTFDPRPVVGEVGIAEGCTPVWGGRGWDYDELLIELVEYQHVGSPAAAAEEALALDWWRPHRCPHRAAALSISEGANV